MLRVALILTQIVFVAAAYADDPPVTEAEESATLVQTGSFAGEWNTDYGALQLTQEGDSVQGRYRLGTVSGTVDGRVLTLRYQESSASGEAEFVLSDDGQRFKGKWRESGEPEYLSWNGTRVLSPTRNFAGLWETSFGLMRLTQTDGEVTGAYDYVSGAALIEGQIKEKRFVFRYKEPEAEGMGWFELADDGMSIIGKWRPDGQTRWQDWTGTRKVAEPDRIWLMILEANWETSIDEPEYAFGDMLNKYFTMATARHVEVRHRFFHDSTDLKRFCKKVQFLAEPVVVLISTHGTPKGITVFGETITADVIAESLRGASNVKLLHLSGCGMMLGDFPNQIHERLGNAPKFPISGYKTTVAWDASALGDFTFLSLLLIRGLDPEIAVRQAIRVSPYLGDDRVPGAAFRPLGLTILQPTDR
ncbi:MAG: hypothetical protein AAGG48_10620 [Planctomycetota bacterium]